MYYEPIPENQTFETPDEKKRRYQPVNGEVQAFCEEYCMTKTKNDLTKSIMFALGVLVFWFGLSFLLNGGIQFSALDLFGIAIPAITIGSAYWFSVKYQKSIRMTLASRECVYAFAHFKDFKVRETATGGNKPTLNGGLKSIFSKEPPYRTFVVLGFEDDDETYEGTIENAELGDTIIVVKRTTETPLSSKYCFKMKWKENTLGFTRNTKEV